jgi:hypothetical protein
MCWSLNPQTMVFKFIIIIIIIIIIIFPVM